MNITCNFAQFQQIMRDESNTIYGGVITYEATTSSVTRATFLNTSRLGLILILSPAIPISAFLSIYPTAIKVASIT